MNKRFGIILVLALVAIAVFAGVFVIQKDQPDLTKACPDKWIEDRMPGPETDTIERQYFIINGQRAKIEEYDIDWMKNNCSVEIEYAY